MVNLLEFISGLLLKQEEWKKQYGAWEDEYD